MPKHLSPRWGVTLIILLAATLILAACQPGDGLEVAATGGLEVWLDQPPDGSILPLAPFPLKAHARDDGGPGVEHLEFLVNGLSLGEVTPTMTGTLAYGETEWNPAVPGNYTIQAQAVNASGSEYSETSHVCVGDNCSQELVVPQPTAVPSQEVTQPTQEGPTFTPIPGLTASPTPTSTFTPTPAPKPPTVCAMSVPALVDPPNGGTVNNANPTFSWSYTSDNCKVEGFRIDICADAACASILQSGGTGNPSTSWGPGTPLNDCTQYYWRVAGVIGSTLGPYSAVSGFNTAFPDGCGKANDTTPPGLQAYTDPSNFTWYDLTGGCSDNQNRFTVIAVVNDDTGIGGVNVQWRYRKDPASAPGDFSDWFSKDMNDQGDGTWRTNIRNEDQALLRKIVGTGNGVVEWIVTATDTANNSSQVNATLPIHACGYYKP